MIGISPIKTNIYSIFKFFISSHQIRLLGKSMIWMFVSSNALLFEDHFQHIDLYLSREDDSFCINSYIGMMKIVSSKHLEEKIASFCPYFA